MTREEQIVDAGKLHASDNKFCDLAMSQHRVMSAYEMGFIDGAVWADSHPNWISVEDELPEHNEEDNGLISYPTVLVCLYDGFRTEDYYDDISGEWRDFDGDVEYWMPMPQPPRKEVRNEKDNVQ